MATVTRSGVAHCISKKCTTPRRYELVPRQNGSAQHGRVWDKEQKKMVMAPEPVLELEPIVVEWDGKGDSIFVSKNGEEWRCIWCGKRISDTERIRDVLDVTNTRRRLVA